VVDVCTEVDKGVGCALRVQVVQRSLSARIHHIMQRAVAYIAELCVFLPAETALPRRKPGIGWCRCQDADACVACGASRWRLKRTRRARDYQVNACAMLPPAAPVPCSVLCLLQVPLCVVIVLTTECIQTWKRGRSVWGLSCARAPAENDATHRVSALPRVVALALVLPVATDHSSIGPTTKSILPHSSTVRRRRCTIRS
jgi:hypothetical protein